MILVLLIAIPLLSSLSGAAAAQPVRDDFYVPNGPVSALVVSGNTVYIGGDFTQVGPASGGGVPFDSATGAPVGGFPRVAGRVLAVAPDGAGGWFIGGDFDGVGGLPRSNLAHVLAGNAVASWDPGADDAVRAIAVSGSRVYVGGSFTHVGGLARNRVAALDAVTGAVTGWNPDAAGAVAARVSAIAVAGVRVYAGGLFSSIGGQPRAGLAALDAATGAATAWSPPSFDGEVLAIAAGGGAVIAAGSFTTIGASTRRHVAALDTATAAVTSWDPDANGDVRAVARAGSRIYAAGAFDSIGGEARAHLAALDEGTGAALAWDPGADDEVLSIAVSGATVYAGGRFTHAGGQSRDHATALDATTASATAWNPDVDGAVDALAASGSVVYAGGEFNTISGKWRARNHLAALDVTSGLLTSWDPGADGTVLALALNGDTVIAGGTFRNVGGLPRGSLAAIDGTTGAVTAWDPEADGFVRALAVSGNTVYAAGGFFNVGGQSRDRIAALDLTTGAATAWDPGASSNVYALAAAGPVIYAAGTFATIGGQARRHIAALDATTGLATSWNPDANSDVLAILPAGGAVYAAGFFTSIGGSARRRVARLDAASGAAAAWDPDVTSETTGGNVSALLLGGSTLYAGGRFTVVGGVARSRLAAIDTSTALPAAWDPRAGVGLEDPLAAVTTLARSGSTILAGGGFRSAGYQPQSYLAAIGDASTPVLFALASVRAEPGRVRIEWRAAAPSLEVDVQRRAPATEWTRIGGASSGGEGRIRFEDDRVAAGARYGYRLGVTLDGVERFFAETWIDVPRAPRLSLRGLRPNPATRDVVVAFGLESAEPATLELLDVTGRRVLARDVGPLGPGEHVVSLAPAEALPQGLYFLRLAQRGRTLIARAVIAR